MALSSKQQRLFGALRELEKSGVQLPRAEFTAHLVRETGYKEVTTYLSKYLGPIVRIAEDDLHVVHGVLAMSEGEFATLLTQKRLHGERPVARYESRDEWAEVLRALLAYGSMHGYVLDEEDGEAVASILPEGLVNVRDGHES